MRELISEAIERNATELILTQDKNPLIKVGGRNEELPYTGILASDWDSTKAELLSGIENDFLNSHGYLDKRTTFNGHIVELSLIQKSNQYRVHFRLPQVAWELSYEPPSIIQSSLDKCQGLSWLSTAEVTRLPKMLVTHLLKLQACKAITSTVYTNGVSLNSAGQQIHGFVETWGDTNAAERRRLNTGSDLIVYMNIEESEVIEEIQYNLNQGKAVWFMSAGTSAKNAICRSYEVLESNFGKFGPLTMAENLSLFVFEKSVPGKNSDLVSLFEVIPGLERIKALFSEGQLHQLCKEIDESRESSGILSLNNSIMSHLLRRTIDLKQAFAHSRNPEKLDEMLKKVGI